MDSQQNQINSVYKSRNFFIFSQVDNVSKIIRWENGIFSRYNYVEFTFSVNRIKYSPLSSNLDGDWQYHQCTLFIKNQVRHNEISLVSIHVGILRMKFLSNSIYLIRIYFMKEKTRKNWMRRKYFHLETYRKKIDLF